MPIVDVEMIASAEEPLPDDLAEQLAAAAGRVFRTPEGRTWVRLRRLDPACYAEDGGEHTRGIRPVFVTVLKARQPPPDRLQDEVAALTTAVARLCDRPSDNVHVVYQQDAVGRIAFGGKLVTD